MLIYRIFFFIIISNLKVLSQSYISDKDWQFHLNLSDINHLASFNNTIYCFGSLGLFSVDLYNNSINRNQDALDISDLSISSTYSDSTYFILGTSSGNIEILFSDKKKTLSLSENKSHIKINSIFLHEENLYVATSSGLFNILLDQLFIKEKYVRFSENEEKSVVNDITVFNNKIYIISSNKVYFFDLMNKNPMDFNFWSELNFNDDTPIGLYVWDNEIFFYSTNSIYDVNQEVIFSNSDIKIKNLKVSNTNIYMHYLNNDNKDMIGYLDNKTLNSITISDKINNITDFIIIENNLWVSGQNFGLLNLKDNISFTPSNSINSNFNEINSIDNTIYGFSNSNIFSYKEGASDWENIDLGSFSNITSVEVFNNKLFFSSMKGGLFNYTDNKVIDNLSDNSLLQTLSNGDIYVGDLESKYNKLWMLNYGATNPLLSFDKDGNWLQYNLNYDQNISPKKFEFLGNDIWISLDKNKGGGILVYNILNGETSPLNINNNKSISNSINDIKSDNYGNMWVASDEGLVYYPSSNLDDYSYIIPNDGNTYLFRGIKITSLEVDFANNIWIGSNNGLFVFNNKKNKLIYQFDENNSPLLSDSISSIETNEFGELFVLSKLGLQSIKTSVLKPQPNLNQVKIYPNPLKLDMHDRLYFSDLKSESMIKITSLSGEVINEFKIEGGGFSWNLLSSGGKKIDSGIFLIFIVSENGNEDLIGKILVI